MIAVLVALRDFVIAVLVGWLGISVDTADSADKQAEQAKPAQAQLTMLR